MDSGLLPTRHKCVSLLIESQKGHTKTQTEKALGHYSCASLVLGFQTKPFISKESQVHRAWNPGWNWDFTFQLHLKTTVQQLSLSMPKHYVAGMKKAHTDPPALLSVGAHHQSSQLIEKWQQRACTHSVNAQFTTQWWALPPLTVQKYCFETGKIGLHFSCL